MCLYQSTYFGGKVVYESDYRNIFEIWKVIPDAGYSLRNAKASIRGYAKICDEGKEFSLRLKGSSNPFMNNMVISNNKAQGGAGMYLADSNPIMSDIVITNNTAINNNGGMTVFNSNLTDEEVLNMSNIIINVFYN